MLKTKTRKPEEIYHVSTTVSAVNLDSTHVATKDWINAPRGNQYFPFLRCPECYRPKEGDPIKVELRLEKRPGNKRRTWSAYIVGWPAQGTEREEIHELVGYDS